MKWRAGSVVPVNKYSEFSHELWNRIKSYLGFLRSSRALKVQNLFRVSPSMEVLYAWTRIYANKFAAPSIRGYVIRGFVNSFPRRENHIVISSESLLVLCREKKIMYPLPGDPRFCVSMSLPLNNRRQARSCDERRGYETEF